MSRDLALPSWHEMTERNEDEFGDEAQHTFPEIYLCFDGLVREVPGPSRNTSPTLIPTSYPTKWKRIAEEYLEAIRILKTGVASWSRGAYVVKLLCRINILLVRCVCTLLCYVRVACDWRLLRARLYVTAWC